MLQNVRMFEYKNNNSSIRNKCTVFLIIESKKERKKPNTIESQRINKQKKIKIEEKHKIR